MVVNPVYRGEVRYGRRSKRRDREEIAASIEPLVSPELWAAAQETLARNRVCAKNTRRIYLLRGVIRCAGCGLTYVGSQRRESVGWYRCNGRNRDRGPLAGRCTGPMVRTDTLEPVIWADIERFLRDPGDLLAELATEGEGSAAVTEVDALLLRRALEGLTAQEQTAISLVVRGVLPEVALRPELDRIATDRTTLEARLATVEAQGAPSLPTMAPELLAEVRARLEAGLTETQRQEIVRLLVGGIVVSPGTASDGTRVTKAAVEYRFPESTTGAVSVVTGTRTSSHLWPEVRCGPWATTSSPRSRASWPTRPPGRHSTTCSTARPVVSSRPWAATTSIPALESRTRASYRDSMGMPR
jgi:Recombinase.